MTRQWFLTLEETANDALPVIATNIFADTLEQALELAGPGFRESTDEEYARHEAYWSERD